MKKELLNIKFRGLDEKGLNFDIKWAYYPHIEITHATLNPYIDLVFHRDYHSLTSTYDFDLVYNQYEITFGVKDIINIEELFEAEYFILKNKSNNISAKTFFESFIKCTRQLSEGSPIYNEKSLNFTNNILQRLSNEIRNLLF